MRYHRTSNKTQPMLLFVLLLAILGMAATEQANATKPTSSKDKEKFAYVRIFSAKIPNELDKPLDELEAIARQYGTEEVAMFHKSVGPEKQVDRWIIRQGSEPHAYPPGLTVKARSHLARQKGLGALQMRGRGKATTTLPEQSARLQWVLPESVRSPLLCDIYENDKLVAVNKIHERLSPSKKQRWPNVIHIDLPQRDWSIIQVFEYLDEEPEGLASLQQGLYEEPAQELHPTRQIPAKASGSGKKKDPAVESSGTTVVKTEPASFTASWPDRGFDLDYDTGWQPGGSPVKVKFDMAAAAKLSASVWGDEWTLRYNPEECNDANLIAPSADDGQGNLEINFGVEMHTRGKVRVNLGFKKVDFKFDIPYAPNFDLRCYDSASFDGYFRSEADRVSVADSTGRKELYSMHVAGVPSIAEVTAGAEADMTLWADMWGDSITTGPIDGDANSDPCSYEFTEVCDSCSVNARKGGEYLALADYNEHLDMGMVLTFYPYIRVGIDVFIYDWSYTLSPFVLPWKLVSGTVDLDLSSRLHFEPTYDLMLTASYGANTVPAPGEASAETEMITLKYEPDMELVPLMHTWDANCANDVNDSYAVDVNASTEKDLNYMFDYWIVDGDGNNRDTNNLYTVEFDCENMFHTLHAVFYRARATEPDPPDRRDRTDKHLILSWTPGEYAVSHDVYFGTDYNDVNDANTTNDPNNVYMGNQLLAENYYIPYIPPANLGECNTYYWRIDEVNDTNTPHRDSPWKGNVWCFRTDGCWATVPSPNDYAVDKPRNVGLSWKPGARVGDANGHIVYIGTNQENVESAREGDFDDLNNCDEDSGVTRCPLDTNSCNIADLVNVDHLPMTYYWRVDEFNDTYTGPLGNLWEGEVWNFTVEYIIVDEFEEYNDIKLITDTWIDGSNLWSSGSKIRLETGANRVYGGKQSMKYIYDNNYPDLGHFSEIEANAFGEENIVAADANGDWTTADVKALVLQYYGEPNDDTTDDDRIYVALEDNNSPIPHIGVAKCDREASDVGELNLNLHKFEEQGVDLTNIRKVYIGFGDPCKIHPEWFSSSLPDPCELAPGGTGSVWFDHMRLYPARCRPEMSRYGGDFDGDCYVDFIDHAIIANDWLMRDFYVMPNPPRDPNLLVEYTFDENDLSDSSLYTPPYDGIGVNEPRVQNKVLTLNGTNFVDVAPDDFNAVNPFDGNSPFSIAMDFNTCEPGILISSAGDAEPNHHSMALFAIGTLRNRDTGEVVRGLVSYGNFYISTITASPNNVLDDDWHHVAITYDANTNSHCLYLDGVAKLKGEFDPHIPNINLDTVRIGGSLNEKFPDPNAAGNFNGNIGSVRIYNCALSPAEVCSLFIQSKASSPGDCWCYQPMRSPANIVDDDPNDWRIDVNTGEYSKKEVNYRDYEKLADNWLKEILWPEEE